MPAIEQLKGFSHLGCDMSYNYDYNCETQVLQDNDGTSGIERALDVGTFKEKKKKNYIHRTQISQSSKRTLHAS